MNIDPTKLEARGTHLQDALRRVAPREDLPTSLISAVIDLARDALKAGRGGLAVPILEMLVALAPREAGAWQLLGFAYGEEQRIAEWHAGALCAEGWALAASGDPSAQATSRAM